MLCSITKETCNELACRHCGLALNRTTHDEDCVPNKFCSLQRDYKVGCWKVCNEECDYLKQHIEITHAMETSCTIGCVSSKGTYHSCYTCKFTNMCANTSL